MHDRLLIIVVPLCEGGPVLSVAAVVKATIIGLETVNHRFAPDTVFLLCVQCSVICRACKLSIVGKGQAKTLNQMKNLPDAACKCF